MKRIILSPFSRPLRNGKPNPKNYPHWDALVDKLHADGHYLIQVGSAGERCLAVDEIQTDLSLDQLKTLLESCNLWISVDNFFNHFATYHHKKGIVLWGQSDPSIFGYSVNANLLKSKMYLRQEQFQIWEAITCNDAAFVSPNRVITEVNKF